MTEHYDNSHPANWTPIPAGEIDPIGDHETNPQFEMHAGRIVAHQDGLRRYVSLWLGAEGRWHGWLEAGEPSAR